MMMERFLFFLVFCCDLMIEGKSVRDLDVTITNGPIYGKFIEVNGRELRAWTGIPYAKPPIGELRFQKPQPPEDWFVRRWTDGQPRVCHQTDDSGYSVLKDTFYRWNPSGEMSEDCLYLNVYAPEKSKTDLHTIVWIHGGGFYKGAVSLDLYDPKYLVALGDVIVVSIQYRLGSFGLLYMGNETIPGNMGLLDQAMAIKWVSDNIEKFGGNRNKITLMGESAGSASVGYHMISNKTRNLFQKVIMMSGSPFNFWAYTSPEESHSKSLLFTSYAGCKNADYDKRRKCLLGKTPEELLAADKSPLSMTPTVDGDFIDKSPFEAIMKNDDFVNKPMLAGLVQNEGMPGIEYFLKSVRKVNYNNFDVEDYKVFLRMMTYYTGREVHEIYHLAHYYLKEYKNNHGDAADQMFGDLFISCAAIDFIGNSTKSGDNPTYFYSFNHRSKMDKDPQYTEVMHGGELQYLFGRPFGVPEEYNDEDRNISQTLISLWTTFIKTGVPDKEWRQYKRNTRFSMNTIEIADDTASTKHKRRFCRQWTKFSSYYETVGVKGMCRFLRSAVWEATNWFTFLISWWVTEGKYCYEWYNLKS